MPVPQQGWPTRPQAPSSHAPPTHIPTVVPPAVVQASPSPAQLPPMQQPPSLQAWPSQHGSPSPPHASQRFEPGPGGFTQAVPGAVQICAPPQQASPTPPHVVVVPTQLASVQVVTVPHSMPSPRQVPDTQQPSAAHVVAPQHGWLSAPHAVSAPAEQTMPLVAGGLSPEARQAPPLQQPPPRQVSPGQQASPGAPHTVQLPAPHVPSAQSAPSATHVLATVSQHPLPEQLSPAQHG